MCLEYRAKLTGNQLKLLVLPVRTRPKGRSIVEHERIH
jgi:hypothetical protein